MPNDYYSTWDNWTGTNASTGTTSDSTWSTWTGSASIGTTAYTTSTAWNNWNDGISAASDGTVWYTWVGPSAGTVDGSLQPMTLSYPPPETEEQKVVRLEQERINQEKWKVAEAVRLAKEKAKEEKARQLLREVITLEQDQQLEKDGYFELVAVKSGHRYRINKGRAGNVQQLDDKTGKVLKKLCFHPTEYVHNYDTMVAQKLMLENDEEQVLRVANFS